MSEPPEQLVFFTDRDLGKRFPKILSDAGLDVRRHADHFAPNCPDEDWLKHVGSEGWVAITHDRRIRYKANEKKAVLLNGVRLLVVVGQAPYSALANNFVATIDRIHTFIAEQPAPWIAKVYRPSAGASQGAAGSVSLWLAGQG